MLFRSNALFDLIMEELERGGKIEISRFGKFFVRLRAGRIGRNPSTGQTVLIPQRKSVVFKIEKKLLAEINGGRKIMSRGAWNLSSGRPTRRFQRGGMEALSHPVTENLAVLVADALRNKF